jgi:hypothetical protein
MICAYFIDGPKHGDRDVLPQAFPEYVVAMAPTSPPPVVDYGHYMARSGEVTYATGVYRRDCELYRHRRSPDSSRHPVILYVWQGVK